MKKQVFIAILLAVVMMVLGCVPTTHYVQKDTYYAGETIKIFDNESDAQLGSLRITRVSVLRDVPYSTRKYLCSKESFDEDMKRKYGDNTELHGDSVYIIKEYAVVVQIDFTSTTIDSSNRITSSDFHVTDCNGNAADREVETDYKILPTEDNSFIVGLEYKGDITLRFSFYSLQATTCDIICKYDNAAGSYVLMADTSEDLTCTGCGKAYKATDSYCRHCGEALK